MNTAAAVSELATLSIAEELPQQDTSTALCAFLLQKVQNYTGIYVRAMLEASCSQQHAALVNIPSNKKYNLECVLQKNAKQV